MARSRCLLLVLLSALASICAAQEADPSGAVPMSGSTLATVRSLLQAYVNGRQVPAPANVFCNDCLIKSWIRHTSFGNYVQFPFSSLHAAMTKYPSQVQEKLRTLIYGANGGTKFENFSVDIQNTHAQKKSFIGLARRVNDMVDLAIMEVDIQAALVQKYVTLSRRVCRRIVLIKRCKTEHYNEPRGYHANEINDMTTLLQSEAFKMYKDLAERIV